ncbi:MAG: hypothetical protein HY097_04140 [Nitrospinae bacterium]|nr:hypothetical protein [Nitrospinota bacterium]
MTKLLMGVFIGVFVGALTYEFLNRTKPELMKKIRAKASEDLNNLLKIQREAVSG